MPGTLILCATPIGNLGDASPRLREVLEEADVVYAEDTRRSRVLLESLGVRRRLRSYFVGNEADRAVELASHLHRDATVALLTDAGTPVIADPGFSAVRAALEAEATVSIVPGPSAVTAALAVSGMPADRFVFEGYLPRKPSGRRRRLEALSGEERTVVLFAATGRVVEDLVDLRDALGGERPVVVVRELTKAFEEVWRGTLSEGAARWGSNAPRGEFTLVLKGRESESGDIASLVNEVDSIIGAGVPLAAAVRRVAEESGVSRRRLYQASLDHRKKKSSPPS